MNILISSLLAINLSSNYVEIKFHHVLFWYQMNKDDTMTQQFYWNYRIGILLYSLSILAN